jgi:hypothetical protein
MVAFIVNRYETGSGCTQADVERVLKALVDEKLILEADAMGRW